MKPYKISSPKNVIPNRHKEFYDAARAHYFNWIEYIRISPKVVNFEKLTPQQIRAFSNNQTLRNASQWGLIVFSAFTLECFINFYAELNKLEGRRKKEKEYGTKKKWRSYPNLIAGKNLSKEIHEDIESIFDLRDNLVHFKPVKGQKPATSFFIQQNGREMLNKLHRIIRSLDDLKSPMHSSKWIGEDFENTMDWESDVSI